MRSLKDCAPEGATHYAVIKCSTNPGGMSCVIMHWFKEQYSFEADGMVWYRHRTNIDNELPLWQRIVLLPYQEPHPLR